MLLLGSSIGIIGLLFILAGIYVMYERRRWLNRARRVAGMVVRHRRIAEWHMAVVRFTTDTGEEREVESKAARRVRAGSPLELTLKAEIAEEVGKPVDVVYDSQNPTQAFIDGQQTGGGWLILFGALCVVFGFSLVVAAQ